MLDYTQLEEEIKKIIELSEKQPEKYQVKCFELLLNAVIKPSVAANEMTVASAPVAQPEDTKQRAEKIDLPIDVQTFLMQYSIPEDAIDKIFLKKGDEIRAKKRVTTEKVATAQMQVAMLVALENALKGPETTFEFGYQKVKELCKQWGKYDGKNFTTNFTNNKKLFVNLADQEHVELSPDGKDELAELVAVLAK
jgi:hypothetical protein